MQTYIDDMDTIGKRIQLARKARNLTQGQLGELVGYSESHISLLERGKRGIEINVLIELAKALQCPVDQLIAENALFNAAPIQTKPRARVPLISWVQAGKCQPALNPYEPGDAAEWIETEINVNKNSYALTVRGDSMEPTFPEGSIIIVDPLRQAIHGSYVVARIDDSDEVTFKQLVHDGSLTYLKPLNPRYPIMQIDRDATICGVVVEMIQRRRLVR